MGRNLLERVKIPEFCSLDTPGHRNKMSRYDMLYLVHVQATCTLIRCVSRATNTTYGDNIRRERENTIGLTRTEIAGTGC